MAVEHDLRLGRPFPEHYLDECDKIKAERDDLRKRLDAADRVHSDTMRGWAETTAERDRYKQALEEILELDGCASSCGAWLRAEGALRGLDE